MTWTRFWVGSSISFCGSLCECESITFGFGADLAGLVTKSVTTLGTSYGFSGGLGSTLQLRANLAGLETVSVIAGAGRRLMSDYATFDGGNCKKCSEDDISELHGDHC